MAESKLMVDCPGCHNGNLLLVERMGEREGWTWYRCEVCSKTWKELTKTTRREETGV